MTSRMTATITAGREFRTVRRVPKSFRRLSKVLRESGFLLREDIEFLCARLVPPSLVEAFRDKAKRFQGSGKELTTGRLRRDRREQVLAEYFPETAASLRKEEWPLIGDIYFSILTAPDANDAGELVAIALATGTLALRLPLSFSVR